MKSVIEFSAGKGLYRLEAVLPGVIRCVHTLKAQVVPPSELVDAARLSRDRDAFSDCGQDAARVWLRSGELRAEYDKDAGRLTWMNAEYIKALSPEAFFEKAKPFLEQAIHASQVDLFAVSKLLQQRCEVLTDIPAKVDFFDAVPEYELDLYTNKKMKTDPEKSLTSLQLMLPVLEGLENWDNDSLYACLVSLAEAQGMKNGALLWPLRVAVSGKASTPGGATELCALLGKEESLKRVRAVIEKLS